MASQNPYSIIVHSVASYRPQFSDFWANVILWFQPKGKESYYFWIPTYRNFFSLKIQKMCNSICWKDLV